MNNFIAHILVVDDDDRIRNLVKDFLSQNKYLISTSANAEDAQKKINLIEFDLIVLDIMMPGMSGLEFISLNKKKIVTPILLLKSDAEDKLSLETGADDYL